MWKLATAICLIFLSGACNFESSIEMEDVENNNDAQKYLEQGTIRTVHILRYI